MSRKIAFIANQKFFHQQKTLRTSLKAVFYARKLLLHVPFFAVRKNFQFSQTKSFSFAESFANCPQKPPFYVQKAFLLHKPFLVAIQSNSFPPSASHFNVP